MKLKELLHGLDVLELHADEDLDITGVQYDSRQVTSGDLFVAISGFQTDGHRYIPKAMENGAVCVVCEKKPETDIAYALVPDARAALAALGFAKLLLFDRVSLRVALVVCLTLAVTVLVAKLVGASLPILAKRLGFDPAVMASPFITTIVDALSLLFFFNIASMLIPELRI